MRDGKANKLRSPSSSAAGNSEYFLEQHHTNVVVIINNFINIILYLVRVMELLKHCTYLIQTKENILNYQ